MARSPSRQKIVAISAFYAMYVTIHWWMLCTYHLRRSIESRTLRTKYLMSYHNRCENMLRMVYESDVTSVVNIRMNIHPFLTLCDMLESRGGLKNSKHMLVDEQVAMFLHTHAHNAKNRILVNRFHRSGETVSRYFKLVLNVVCRLHKEFYKLPVPVPDNETDERWKWFKGLSRSTRWNIYRESCKYMKEVLLRFGEMVGEQLSKDGIEAREIYEKVNDELKAIPGITMKKRFKAAHLIGKDVVLGRSFLVSTTEEKIAMIELYTDGSTG